MVKLIEKIDRLEEYILKLDKEPNLYFIKLNVKLPMENITDISSRFNSVIQSFSPESQMVILSNDFSPIIMPSEDAMKELGWAKIITEKEKNNELESKG